MSELIYPQTTTIFEDLSVEVFYKIFAYFQWHELLKVFSELNCRLTTVLIYMPLVPVSLGFNGMSMVLTQFYHRCLSETNTCSRLISLRVSDTMAFGNGTWLGSHIQLFVALRHLALIDIQRADFESILNALSSVSLVKLSMKFTKQSRAMWTYEGVPEGTYHDQIFRSLPQLRVCQLGFRRLMYFKFGHIQPDVNLTIDSTFASITTIAPRLQSLFLVSCSSAFLSHLVRYVPQLQELSLTLCRPWLPDGHLLMSNNVMQNNPIDGSLVPNLRRLKIFWNNCKGFLELNHYFVAPPTQLFTRDVYYRLTHFSLLGECLKIEIIHELLSMLSAQCSYSLNISRIQEIAPIVWEQSTINNILLNTFRQLKARKTMEVMFQLDNRNLCVYTLPRKCREVDLASYLKSQTVVAHDRWPGVVRSNYSFPSVIRVVFDMFAHRELIDDFISYLPSMIPWHQIVHLTVNETLKLSYLRSILSYGPRLHTLKIQNWITRIDQLNNNERLLLIDLLDDASTCQILMSNGLRKLIFLIPFNMPNMTHIAHMIVKYFPRLHIVEMCGFGTTLPIFLHTLINGLPKLTFLIADCGLMFGKWNELQLHALQTPDTRPFRTEILDSPEGSFVYIWL